MLWPFTSPAWDANPENGIDPSAIRGAMGESQPVAQLPEASQT